MQRLTASPIRDTRAGYLLAVGSVCLAFLLTRLAWPFVERTPFFLLFGATMASAWWGGTRAGLLSIPLAAIAQVRLVDASFPPVFTVRAVVAFVVLAVVVNLVISSRRRIEAALEASEAQFRAAWEHAAAGAVLLKADGSIVRVNPACERILGCSESDCVGTRLLDFTHPDDRDAEAALFAELAAGQRSEYRREQRYRKREGSVMWGHVVASVIRGSDGRPQGALLLLEDITERKALEEQLRQVQKLEALGHLAAGVAHDFNNFLTAMSGYAELALKAVGNDELVSRNLTEVLEAGRRATALTRQLLLFSRRPKFDPEPLSVDAVTGSFVSMLQRLLGKGIRITTVLRSRDARVRVDPSHLEQVLVNLSVNARDAMPKGGVLTIETATVDLDETDGAESVRPVPGPYVMLAVSDTGCGMDQEVKAHLFEPFFTTKEAGKGTGLGLAIVYGIVKQSGGHVLVSSEPGHGSTFKLYFPTALAREARPAAPAVASTPAPADGETVLVAEEEASVRALVCTILEKHGYRVLEATTGERALALADAYSGRIRVVVADLSMPGMSGVELIAHLRERRPDLPALLTSGFAEHGLLSQGGLGAGTVFLQKPFTGEQLLDTVQGVLDAHPVRG